jgi:hypothetical protein
MIETTRPPGSSGRGQRLAFVYHPRSFGTMSIVEAAEGVCELVWVVDTGIGETQLMVKLLRRLGTVVDVAGMSMDSAASAVAATHPDGVVALSDAMLEWTAQLAQRLGLSFHLPAVAERFTDKLAQRAALREAGVAVPGFWNVPETSDQAAWAQLAEEARFPAVVKPRRSEGSRDTVRVGSLGEVQAIADNTRSGSLILEEYLADRPEAAGRRFADYVSIESIVSEREISHLAITGRFPPAEPFRESGFFIDCELSDEDRSVALELAGAAVTALAVSNGCLHRDQVHSGRSTRDRAQRPYWRWGSGDALRCGGNRAPADRHASRARRADRVRPSADHPTRGLPVLRSRSGLDASGAGDRRPQRTL